MWCASRVSAGRRRDASPARARGMRSCRRARSLGASLGTAERVKGGRATGEERRICFIGSGSVLGGWWSGRVEAVAGCVGGSGDSVISSDCGLGSLEQLESARGKATCFADREG